MAPVVQEVVSRPGWQSGNALALVIKGNGVSWSRKIANAYEAGAANVPTLLITYQSVAVAATPTRTATALPTATATPTATSGPLSLTAQVSGSSDDVNEDGTSFSTRRCQRLVGQRRLDQRQLHRPAFRRPQHPPGCDHHLGAAQGLLERRASGVGLEMTIAAQAADNAADLQLDQPALSSAH